MKKIRSKLLLLLDISLVVIGSLYINPAAQALQCSGVDTGIIDCENTGAGAVREILLKILDIMTVGIGVLGAIGITIVGIQYLTASDNVQQTTKAKKRLYEIVIGLAVYVLLYGIIQWVMPGGKLNTEKIEVTGVSISIPGSGIPDSITTGSTVKLIAVLDPIDADNSSIEWESSDDSIATVDKKTGLVTTKKAGKVTIKVTTSNTTTSSVELNIEDPPPEPEPDPIPNSDPVADSGNYHKIGNALAVAHANSYGSLTDTDIQYALNNKFWGLECDLEYDDRGFMCYHPPTDGTSFRSSNNPSLEKTIETCKGKGVKKVILDIKDLRGHYGDLGTFIKQRNLQGTLIGQISSVSEMQSINNSLGSKLEYWGLAGDASDINSYVNNANAYRNEGMTTVNIPSPNTTWISESAAKSGIQNLKSHGFKVCIYTFTTFSQSEINTYNSLGVEYLMTNGSQ